MKLLLLSRGSKASGGVANLVSQWKSNYSGYITLTEYIIGGKESRFDLLFKYIRPLHGAVILYFKLGKNIYDVVHINPSFNLNSILRDGLYMLVLRSKRQPTLVFFHGWNIELSNKIVSNRMYRWLLKNSFGCSKRILVLAKSFRDALIAAGIGQEKIYITTTMFNGKQLQNITRRNISEVKNILFLSRFIREKGAFELVDAFKLINEEFPKVHLIMAGDGPIRESLEKKVAEFGLKEVVTFTGYIREEDKLSVLNNSEIFVLPSYGEGCPVSMLEAMACGLGVITTPVGGIPDIINDNENGVLLPSVTPVNIYIALKRLITSPDLLENMSENNYVKAWNNYEAGIVTAKLEKFYDHLAGA